MSKIHVLGASGSGTTTLAKAISKKYNFFHMDTDNYFWEKTDIPFTSKRPVDERIKLIKKDISENENIVMSGIFYPWAGDLKDEFDYMIYIETAPEVRKRRLIEREYVMFGDRMLKGGDMHEQFKRFLKWALNYENDLNDDIGKTKTEQWLKNVRCKVLRVNGALPLEQIMEQLDKELFRSFDKGEPDDDYII